VKATVLNVDDNSANRYVKSRVLRTAGFEVIEAATGESALSAAAERHPDLVLLDIRLPDISGIEVCRRLRGNPGTQRIPIVHISATHVSPKDEATSLDAGADIYLAEPIAPQELSSAVRTLLRLRRTEQGLAATEQRLRLATEGAGIFTWEIDCATRSALWSRQFGDLLGSDILPTFDSWVARVHPQDRAALEKAFSAAAEGQGDFASEHRLLLASGEERCIAAFGRRHAGDGGEQPRLIGVATDITARKRAEAEREVLLARAQEAQRLAEQAVRMKDEFLAMLSHELRTPMSAMLGWLHLLKIGKLSADQQMQALDTIERNARIQTQLVNDLLDVSRIVTGKMELETEVMPLDRALESALDSARLEGQAREIALEAEIARGQWLVRGNPQRLQQVFSNLLSNALKFSPKGSRILVRLERTASHAQVSVIDQGEGIPPDVLPHIFERFRQADSSTRRRHGGLGLGLAIVRSLVELHGGRVTAESAGPGLGATFRVGLPLAGPAAAPPAPDPAFAGEADLTGVRALIVDDDQSNLQMIAQLLRLHGASVMIASDAPTALAIAPRWDPDALILDIGMPEKDGYQLLPELRAALGKDARTMPAIAVTGFASTEDMKRALQAGFQAHIAKPFDMSGLCHLVAQLAPRARRADLSSAR
jgi:PAS domain S-box-containing protein